MRTTAKARLTRNVNSLFKLQHLDGNNLNEAELIFDDVKRAWDNVENKHGSYTAALTENADVEDSRIEPEENKFKDVRREFMKYKETIVKKRSRNEAFQKRTICDTLFKEQCDSIKLSMERFRSAARVSREKTELQRKLDDLENAHKDILLLPESSDEWKWMLVKYQETKRHKMPIVFLLRKPEFYVAPNAAKQLAI